MRREVKLIQVFISCPSYSKDPSGPCLVPPASRYIPILCCAFQLCIQEAYEIKYDLRICCYEYFLIRLDGKGFSKRIKNC